MVHTALLFSPQLLHKPVVTSTYLLDPAGQEQVPGKAALSPFAAHVKPATSWQCERHSTDTIPLTSAHTAPACGFWPQLSLHVAAPLLQLAICGLQPPLGVLLNTHPAQSPQGLPWLV